MGSSADVNSSKIVYDMVLSVSKSFKALILLALLVRTWKNK